MAYDYDRLYGRTRDALGPPTPILVDFFARYPKPKARVLDLGCGQGRDAVFIARRGHSVVGIDLSANGIRDLTAVARKENLPIEARVADIRDFRPSGPFDIVLIDRVLHMLAREARLAVLSGLLDHVDSGGWMLIADEPSNIGDFRAVIAAHHRPWRTGHDHRGWLFMGRA